MRPFATPFFLAILNAQTAGAVVLGNQRLRDDHYALLEGRSVAVLSNPTGVFQDTLVHLVDDMTAAGVNIRAILSPEHGFRGDFQAESGDPFIYRDDATGLPVLSAYKMDASQLAVFLKRFEVDCIVADLQDVGVRLYTFVWTMYTCMQAVQLLAGQAAMVVLDRPNPLGGVLVDGPLLNMSCCASGYGRLPITHIHGMTYGELALFFNVSLGGIGEVVVVPCLNWTRDMVWEDTGLSWVPPSPNLPTPLATQAYGATVFVEATTVAEGRGTTTPFTLFGAPFMDATGLSLRLNEGKNVPLSFRAAYFSPSFSKYNGTDCSGVQWVNGASPAFTGAIEILIALKDLGGDAFAWDGSWFGHPGTELIDEYAGTPLVREYIDAGVLSADEISAAFAEDIALFRQKRAPFLIYP
mmetsp:Transcript_76995/g.154441  ORF Transcript_76995/g.154441 Transcript_76995/m.154441 type:complete len:411 (-) Transcript_76995:26-1258(-)